MPNVSKKKNIIKDIAYIIVISFIVMHLIPLFDMLLHPVVYRQILKTTFIYDMYLEDYEKKDLKNIFSDFNDMADKKIIHYKGVRPIFIYEKKLPDTVLGTAIPMPGLCIIALTKNMKPEKLKAVLIHEYLHCMGYEHTNIYCDLMYTTVCPYLNNSYLKSSMEKYANSLLRNFYE